MDRAINSLGHENNIVDWINDTDKLYLKIQMELLGKLASNDTSNIGMFLIASNDLSIKYTEQCFSILTKNDQLNELKSSTKIKDR